MNAPFTIAQMRPIREAMTVSRPAKLGNEVPVTWFSLGAGTSITPERYDCTTLYLGAEGSGTFLLGGGSPVCSDAPRAAAGGPAPDALRDADRLRDDLHRSDPERGGCYHE